MPIDNTDIGEVHEGNALTTESNAKHTLTFLVLFWNSEPRSRHRVGDAGCC